MLISVRAKTRMEPCWNQGKPRLEMGQIPSLGSPLGCPVFLVFPVEGSGLTQRQRCPSKGQVWTWPIEVNLHTGAKAKRRPLQQAQSAAPRSSFPMACSEVQDKWQYLQILVQCPTCISTPYPLSAVGEVPRALLKVIWQWCLPRPCQLFKAKRQVHRILNQLKVLLKQLIPK